MDKMKVVSSRLARGAFLAVGVPYVIVIVTNLVRGWPCSQEGEDRFKRALQPNRVLKVTYALAEQLSLAKWLPLYIRWTSFYKTASNVVKDIPYGRHGNVLDLWMPELMKDGKHIDCTFPNQSSRGSNGRPIIVFVYGGAWGSGDKNMYSLLAQQIIEHLGAAVIIPNYSTYPKGTVPEMVEDLHDTLAFIQSQEFCQLAPSANQQEVILFGHSAGAHLCALSSIDLAEGKAAALSVTPSGASVTADRKDHEGLAADNSQHCSHEVAGNSEYASALLSSVRGVVGLGGVYHIMDHYHHESWRGVEDLSPMWQAMGGMDQFDVFSPVERLRKMTPDQLKSLPPFYLIHGTKDSVVPPSASEKFATVLSDQEVDVTLKMIVEGGHAELIIDAMDSSRKFHDAVINALTEMRNSILKCD
ncbi:uncharacterized protein [Diadema antillarum]|uniref:uncharacterized protein n=1 Tax=Diadema antillarum TaxID=105358 RepID=UPI003A8775E2